MRHTSFFRVMMAASTMRLSEWFWDDRVWLPPNVTWSHIQSTPEVTYFEFTDLGSAEHISRSNRDILH